MISLISAAEIERCRNMLKHTIGLDYKKPYKRHGKYFYKPYRNYYCAGKKEDWYLEKLVKHGIMDKEISKQGFITYKFNRQGLDLLGEDLDICIYDE